MRRGIQSWMVILVAISLPVFWLFRPVASLPARFSLDDCQQIALTDSATGQPITGVDDMELLSDGDTLILSALDRLALDWHPDEVREGGLYEVSVAQLAEGQPWATPIVQTGAVSGGLYPQAIAVSDDGERLAFINRSRDGAVSVVLGSLSRGAFSFRTARTDPLFCRANDLIFAGGGTMEMRITLDRGSCGFSWDDLKPSSTTGRVISVDLGGVAPPMIEETGLAFANGIAGLYVAETRASRLHHRLDLPVLVPGGPDNLTWDPLGGLIAAVHPSFYQMAAYRFGYFDTAPSRIVRVDLDRTIEVLFDDTSGAVFSGASVAVIAGGVLVAGSMRDAGLLVCQKRKS